MSWVANTGMRNHRNWMEWVNITIVFIMIGCILARVVTFLFRDGGCSPWEMVGPIMFGTYITLHMWPMAAISIQERLSGLKDDEVSGQVDLPVPILYSALTIFGVLVLARGSSTPCAAQSTRL